MNLERPGKYRCDECGHPIKSRSHGIDQYIYEIDAGRKFRGKFLCDLCFLKAKIDLVKELETTYPGDTDQAKQNRAKEYFRISSGG